MICEWQTFLWWWWWWWLGLLWKIEAHPSFPQFIQPRLALCLICLGRSEENMTIDYFETWLVFLPATKIKFWKRCQRSHLIASSNSSMASSRLCPLGMLGSDFNPAALWFWWQIGNISAVITMQKLLPSSTWKNLSSPRKFVCTWQALILFLKALIVLTAWFSLPDHQVWQGECWAALFVCLLTSSGSCLVVEAVPSIVLTWCDCAHRVALNRLKRVPGHRIHLCFY